MFDQEPLEPQPRPLPQPHRRHAIARVMRIALTLTLLVAFAAGGWFASGQLNPSGTAAGDGSNAPVSAELTSASALQDVQTGDLSVADVADQVGPAVVTITNLQDVSTRFGGQSELQPVSKGSGFIIDEEGHVVTNNHVIAGASDLEVEFADGTTVKATVIGSDPFQDVAVIQLDLSDGTTVPGTVPFGDSDSLQVGEEVIAIGSALGELTNTVTDGNVNAVDRSLDAGGYLLEHLIQHDADIWPGNSGGPLLNLQGEVIGMNVAKVVDGSVSSDLNGEGIGFAIDSNAVKTIVDEIIATGTFARPYLGIRGQQTAVGQAVEEVTNDGPAADAGLQPGDVITAIDDTQVDENHPFLNLLFDHSPGDQVTLTVDRDGESISVDIVLGERPAEAS